MINTLFFIPYFSHSHHLKDQNPLPLVIVLIQACAVDLVDKQQVIRCHKQGDLALERIVEIQVNLPGIFIIGFPDPVQHNL